MYERYELMDSLRYVLCDICQPVGSEDGKYFMYPTHNRAGEYSGLLVGDEDHAIVGINFKSTTEGLFFDVRVSFKYLTPDNINTIKKILERIGMLEEVANTKYRPAMILEAADEKAKKELEKER